MNRKQRRALGGAGSRRPATSAVPELLAAALQHHQAGRLTEAEGLYGRILDVEPDHAHALHLLGVAALQGDRPAVAAEWIGRAIARNDAEPDYHANLGIALQALGRLAEAESSHHRALALRPDHGPDNASGNNANVLNNLAVTLQALGRPGEAEARFRQALALRPDYAEAHGNLAGMLHNLDRHAEADAHYRRTLDLDPSCAEMHDGLGSVLLALGRPDAAETCHRRALALDPRSAEAHTNLGNALKALGRLAEAESCHRHALALRADFAEAHDNLGLVHQDQGRPDAAEACHRRALALQPTVAAVHNHLGAVLQALGRPDDAADCHRRAIALQPGEAEAHNNLGTVLLALEQPAEAETCFRRAAWLRPGLAEAHGNLAALLQRRGAMVSAEARYRRALAIKPDFAAAHTGLGVALEGQGRLTEAEACHRHALALRPDDAEAHNNLGTTLLFQGRHAEAEACYRHALARKPALPMARLNAGLMALARGDLTGGWEGYEARFEAGLAHPRRRFPVPAWTGEDLTGRTVLVWREQGLGDELMFGSCYADLIARAGPVVIECDPRLVALFARSFPTATVRREGAEAPGPVLEAIDFHAPAGSLPRRLRPNLAAFPTRAGLTDAGYLVADPERVAFWRHRLAALGDGPKVGLAWRSALMTASRRHLYTSLEPWAPVLTRPGMVFINLQYGHCEDEIVEAESRLGVTIARWSDLDLMNDLDEVAALTTALDRVISAATAVGEMAGALGVPVWRFARVGDWTTLGTDRRPWFPSMRLFYAAGTETLDDVLVRIGQALEGV